MIFGLMPGFVHDFADRSGDARLDAQALLFLDRGLNAAPLDEVLRLDDRRALRPRRRSWRRGAQRSAGPRAPPRCRRSRPDRSVHAVPPWLQVLRQTLLKRKRPSLDFAALDPRPPLWRFVPASLQATEQSHADRTQDARPLPDDGGGHARQMAGQGRRHGHVRRHPRRDRDRQGDDGVRGGRRRHDREDPGARRHRRGEGRQRRSRCSPARARMPARRAPRRKADGSAAPKRRSQPQPEAGNAGKRGAETPAAPPQRRAAAAAAPAAPTATASRRRPLARRLAEAQGIDLSTHARVRARAAGSSRPTSTAAAGKAPLQRPRRSAAGRAGARPAVARRSDRDRRSRTRRSSSRTCARRSRAA